MTYIKRSIFVNALQEVEMPGLDGISGPSINPIVSLFMLSAAAKARKKPSSFAKLVAEFPENIELKEEGRPLECCAMWWLRMRLATAAGKKDFPLENLLGIETTAFSTDTELEGMLNMLKSVLFNVPCDSLAIRTCLKGKGKLPNSYDKPDAFLDAVATLNSNQGYVWLLAVFDTVASKWFVVFVDLKAKKSFKDDQQAQHVQVLVEEAQKRANVAPSSLLEALQDKRYCFLYVTTAEGASSANELAITMRREDTKRFFGPLSAIHSAIRKAFRAAEEPLR